MKEHKYSNMDYDALLAASVNVRPGRDARALHKVLRNYGDGLPFLQRHPYLELLLPAIISAATALLIRALA